jgi:hypothetical protein
MPKAPRAEQVFAMAGDEVSQDRWLAITRET